MATPGTCGMMKIRIAVPEKPANATHLREIDMGSWCLRGYDEVEHEVGPIRLPDHLLRPAPDGEDYPAIAARLQHWLDGPGAQPGTHIVVMHGISSRVMRGVMTGAPVVERFGAPAAAHLPQGSLVMIERGVETVVHLGGGGATV